MDKDVCDFQISMYHILFRQILQTIINIFYIIFGLLLSKSSFSFQFAFQIALITQLGDYIAVSITREDFEAFQYVGMI